MKIQVTQRFIISLLIILFIVLVGVTSFAMSFYTAQLKDFPNDFFVIKTNPYNISFYEPRLQERIVSISPFDDYLYSGRVKYHPSEKETFIRLRNSSYNPFWLIKSVFEGKDYKGWVSEDREGIPIEYNLVANQEGRLEIIRTLNDNNEKITAIGQTLIYCDSCFIKDNKGRIYFNNKADRTDNISFAKSIGLIPVFVNRNEKLPEGITTFSIIDRVGNEKVVIPSDNIETYFNEDWKQVEFKRPLQANRSVKQVLLFIN